MRIRDKLLSGNKAEERHTKGCAVRDEFWANHRRVWLGPTRSFRPATSCQPVNGRTTLRHTSKIGKRTVTSRKQHASGNLSILVTAGAANIAPRFSSSRERIEGGSRIDLYTESTSLFVPPLLVRVLTLTRASFCNDSKRMRHSQPCGLHAHQ